MKSAVRQMVLALGWLMALCIGGGAAWAGEVRNTPIRYRLLTKYNIQPYSFNFPYLRLDDPAAAEKVNALLHHSQLQTLPPESAHLQAKPEPQNLDANPGKANAGLEGVGPIKTGKIETIYDGRVLLVPISRMSCGGSCSSGTVVYAFDTKTGRLLVMPEIFTRGSIGFLAEQSSQARRAKLNRIIAQLKKKLKADKKGGEVRVEIEKSISLYEGCLADDYREADVFHGYGVADLSFTDGHISFETFFHGSCAPANHEEVSVLGTFAYVPTAKQLRLFLTPYGKYLVFGEGEPAVPAINPYAQIFKGTIDGRLAVTLYAGGSSYGGPENWKPFSEATYYYDKYRNPIPLSVTREGDTYTLTELGVAEQAQADPPKLVFHIEGNQLKGQWLGAGKTYAFEATAL